MKYINRWGLMRNTRAENIAEHSQQVAVITHALSLIENEIFGGKVAVEKAVLYALYHESAEVLTGDLPTPVKYFNGEITKAYKKIERHAEEKLLQLLPAALQPELAAIVQPDLASSEYALVKAADRLSAYIKCIEELRAGNGEFAAAAQTTKRALEKSGLKCVEYFMNEFLPAYSLTIDELL